MKRWKEAVNQNPAYNVYMAAAEPRNKNKKNNIFCQFSPDLIQVAIIFTNWRKTKLIFLRSRLKEVDGNGGW